MNPLLIAGAVVLGAALIGRRQGAPASSAEAAAPSKGGDALRRMAAAAAARTPVAADGRFGARVAEAGASGASGYRGGTSPPRLRRFTGPGQAGNGARSDGLPLSMSQVAVPWAPGHLGGYMSIQNREGVPIATLSGIRDAFRWDTDRGFNDADRAWAPAVLFDGDDVAWIYEVGRNLGQWWDIGTPSFVSVGMGECARLALDAEHQLTGATAEWSRAAWELDAPRAVNRGGVWRLEGFGAAQLEEGQRFNINLGREWAQRVNGRSIESPGRWPWDGTTARTVWSPLIARARQQIGRPSSDSAHPPGTRVWDDQLLTR